MLNQQVRRVAQRLAGSIVASVSMMSMFVHDASAAALQVSPIRLDLGADKPAAALTLRNEGAVPLNAQVRVFAWTQSPDEDRLERTTLIVASPPIVRIAPNAEQTVRILRVADTPLAREETYRLLIDEIPNAQTPETNGVRMQLRYSVPVFAGAQDARVPALSFALERKDAQWMLRASNGADTHAQLSRVSLEWPNGQSTAVSSGLLGYTLPHATRRWPVASVPGDPASVTVHALVNGEPLTARIAIEPARASPATDH